MLKILTLVIFLFPGFLISQDPEFISIHQLENARYKKILEENNYTIFDQEKINYHRFNNENEKSLKKRIFGYHPYWSGNKYIQYQWDLLTDLCFFSYEVDPSTGEALTTNNWETTPVIDTALVNNVDVHLCVTLFSGHAAFFTNSSAQETLIQNIINLLLFRGAHGVNIDFEAMSSIYRDAFTTFIVTLHEALNNSIPAAEFSIAAPAVNWSDRFDIQSLEEELDFFMVMAYDYYWYGSSVAGPVSPLYSMTGSYDYNFSRTLSYYQSQGVPNEKIIMGIPYYAYQWTVEEKFAPSLTTGSGFALTYSNIKDNTSGNYIHENQFIEPNSFGPYFAFETSSWNHCFIDNLYSAGEKYDIVNCRNIKGIGIWALGYDHGCSELWQLIAAKFTEGNGILSGDTIYDSGGPGFDYYNNENYLFTISTPQGSRVHLTFIEFDLELGYDTLKIYDGIDSLCPLAGSFTGNDNPPKIVSSGNHLTLHFKSDAYTADSGWKAIYDTIPVSAVRIQKIADEISVFPNPSSNEIYIKLKSRVPGEYFNIRIYNSQGIFYTRSQQQLNILPVRVSVKDWPKGVYTIDVGSEEGIRYYDKVVVF